MSQSSRGKDLMTAQVLNPQKKAQYLTALLRDIKFRSHGPKIGIVPDLLSEILFQCQ